MADVYDKDLQTIVKVGKVYALQTVTPTAANDSTQGYHIGDIWVVQSVPSAYMCLVDTAGAATWHLL